MHIVAVAVEPEFVKVHDLSHGAASIEIEIARMQVTDMGRPNSGSVRLELVASDVETILAGLLKVKQA